MTIRPLFVVALFLCLHTFGFQNQITAEDWSIRKINPFGKRSVTNRASKETKQERKKSETAKVKPKTEKVKPEEREVTASVTTMEIKNSFSRIGQGTAAAFARTRDALTPDFEWPKWEPLRIKFPRLKPNTIPDEAAK